MKGGGNKMESNDKLMKVILTKGNSGKEFTYESKLGGTGKVWRKAVRLNKTISFYETKALEDNIAFKEELRNLKGESVERITREDLIKYTEKYLDDTVDAKVNYILNREEVSLEVTKENVLEGVLEYIEQNLQDLKETSENKAKKEDILNFTEEYNESYLEIEERTQDLIVGFIADVLFDGQFTADEFEDGYSVNNELDYNEFLTWSLLYATGTKLSDLVRSRELDLLEKELEYRKSLDKVTLYVDSYGDVEVEEEKEAVEELDDIDKYNEAVKKQ